MHATAAELGTKTHLQKLCLEEMSAKHLVTESRLDRVHKTLHSSRKDLSLLQTANTETHLLLANAPYTVSCLILYEILQLVQL